ncbi:uncharacterized protein LOC110458130 [Mizuhopecten yessoensis]|uniref:uncharacterized protein LOC110458130 n=1 Tax=Mizuhopecten yessoensis TaxID=6573 RepID=UPI000B458FFB|nr:uncharacterized protein LOC110458130 [Mizuhopecten yessoensis]
MCAAMNMFVIMSRHVPGKSNLIADTLSRLQIRRTSPGSKPPAMPGPTSIGGILEVGRVVADLWEAALAPSTLKTYHTGYNTFVQFLPKAGLINSVNLAGMCVTEDLLIQFVAYCHSINLTYTTIKLYVCGIRFMCMKNNITYPNSAKLNRMQAILGGVKRTNIKVTKPRHPDTFDILKALSVYLRSNATSFGNLMLETVCIVAFYGFLRCGDFTVKCYFDRNINLYVQDLVIADEYVLLRLRTSKTDPFREGITLKLFKTDNSICPYVACCKYVEARQQQNPSQDDPLFVDENDKVLTRNVFIEKFKHVLECLGINSNEYNGHSFRIGAATSASTAHVQDHLIKILGR